MKRFYPGVAVIIVSATIFTSCEFFFGGKAKKTDDGGGGRDSATIVINNSDVTGDTSFTADVEVYSKDHTSVEHASLINRYSITQWAEADRMLIRLDFDAAYTDTGRPRSIVSDDEELIVFDPETMEIHERAALSTIVCEETRRFALPRTAIPGRLKMPALREMVSRLKLDVTGTLDSGPIMISLNGINAEGFVGAQSIDTHIRTDYYIDGNTGTLEKTETEYASSDGSRTLIEENHVYEERGDLLIPVGNVVHSVTQAPPLPDVEDEPTGLSISSPDEVPTVTDDEYESLMNSDQYVVQEVAPYVGDPKNPVIETTYVSVYNNIQINADTSAAFRILTK